MTAWSSFVTSLRAKGVRTVPEAQRPPSSGPPFYGAQFTSVARFRVDSPWISPKTTNVWVGHG
jgi:hypothetical protein